jgi:hypothetical protein
MGEEEEEEEEEAVAAEELIWVQELLVRLLLLRVGIAFLGNLSNCKSLDCIPLGI